MAIKGLQTPVGYDEEQDYSWARASAFMGGKLLQNKAVIKIIHDGSAFAEGGEYMAYSTSNPHALLQDCIMGGVAVWS
ncbi:MAG: hypothetical protein ACR5LF_00290 [Symbiopectobacterium sp.]